MKNIEPLENQENMKKIIFEIVEYIKKQRSSQYISESESDSDSDYETESDVESEEEYDVVEEEIEVMKVEDYFYQLF